MGTGLWLLGAGRALAYTFATDDAGTPLRWDVFPVPWAWSPGSELDPDGAGEAVHAGFDAWDGIEGSAVAFSAQRARGASVVDVALPNAVFFVSDWPHDPELLALTSAWADEEGRILGFDVVVNGDKPWSTSGAPDAYDLEAAVVHEVGHALGLSHSEIPEAAMFATAAPGALWRRALHEDDLEAVRTLYPEEEARDRRPESPPWGVGCDAGPRGASVWAIGACLLWLRRGRAR